MVGYIGRRSDSPIKIIDDILREAKLPECLYSINQEKEGRICVVEEHDGLHVFIFDRGVRCAEGVADDWKTVISYIEDNVDTPYEHRIRRVVRAREKKPAASIAARYGKLFAVGGIVAARVKGEIG